LIQRPVYVSLANLIAAAGVTLTPSTEDANWLATNVQSPARPFLPWKTTAVGSDQNLVVDFGSAKTFDLVVLVAVNFANASVQANSSASWSTPPYNHAITITRNPHNRRYQYGLLLAPALSYQYLRLLIPAQTPVDGASAFKVGGIWVGMKTKLPSNFLADGVLGTITPLLDVAPAHRGWRQRLSLGEPVATIKARRWAKTSSPHPLVNDNLKTWMDFDRQTTDADVFALVLNSDDASHAYIMRHLDEPTWSLSRRHRSESSYELEEVTGP
jgi:hypothetical protein